MWTRFIDRYSGGDLKTPHECIYVEGPEREAAEVFEHRFGLSPYGEFCECCGSDYLIDQVDAPEPGEGTVILRAPAFEVATR